MPVIGGMTQLDRPDHRRGAARHDPAARHGDDLLGAQPADRRRAADPLRHHRAERHRRAGARRAGGAARRSAKPPQRSSGRHERCRPRRRSSTVSGLGKRFGGFVALENIDLTVARRRAARPDRAERLRQEHARQLPVRHVAQRDRQRRVRRPAARRPDRASSAPGSGSRAAFNCRSRSTRSNLVDNLRVPLLYTVNAAARAHHLSAAAGRRALPRAAAARSASPTRRGGCRAT